MKSRKIIKSLKKIDNISCESKIDKLTIESRIKRIEDMIDTMYLEINYGKIGNMNLGYEKITLKGRVDELENRINFIKSSM